MVSESPFEVTRVIPVVSNNLISLHRRHPVLHAMTISARVQFLFQKVRSVWIAYTFVRTVTLDRVQVVRTGNRAKHEQANVKPAQEAQTLTFCSQSKPTQTNSEHRMIERSSQLKISCK